MIQRNITKNLLAALSDTPVVLLNGARQTGKSTLVQSLLKGQHQSSAYPGGSDWSVPDGQHQSSAYPGGSDWSVPDGQHPARYFTLDDVSVLAAARHDPAGFLASQKGAVVIDEVQRAPELFVAIKAEVDRDR